MIWAPAPYRAGFCITDDTDAATLESVRVVYDFLAAIGLRTTKTVWAFEPAEPCGIPALPPSILRGITLEDRAYLDYCVGLREAGFEICLHGASSGNNVRARTLAGLDLMERRFGRPGTYVCHAKNAENPYWHEKVAPRGPAQWLLRLASRYRCSGEDPDSPYFWGDACLERVRQIRLFRTRAVNTLARNPSMPYFDPEKPLVASWFSATKRSFHDVAAPAALEALVRERGLCVLYQYLQRYADRRTGAVDTTFRADAERLVAQPGLWVDTTSAIMDRLRLIQGIFLAAGGHHDVWVANTNATDVTGLQLELPRRTVWHPAAGIEREGNVLRIARVPAAGLVRLEFDLPPSIPGGKTVPLDDRGRGWARFRFGEVAVNTGAKAWERGGGDVVPPATCHAVPDPGMGGLRPLSVPSATEVQRLLAGQLAIIAREILFKGRSVDSGKFLGGDQILLEDHSTW